YDAANRLAEIHAGAASGPLQAAFVHDDNGNVTSDGKRSYTWDALDQLSSVSTAATTVAYGYDGEGRRVRKTLAAVDTLWLYDGQNIHAQYQAGWGNPAAVYTHAGTDTPLIKAAVTGPASYGVAQYYHADGLGNVLGLNGSDNT